MTRDLSFQDGINDPEMPFRCFVEACTEFWSRAVVLYEAEGSPNDPANEGSTVSSWFEVRMDAAEAVEAANDLLSDWTSRANSGACFGCCCFPNGLHKTGSGSDAFADADRDPEG